MKLGLSYWYLYINFEILGHKTSLVRSWPIYIKLRKNNKGVFYGTVAIGRVSHSELSGWCLSPPLQSCARHGNLSMVLVIIVLFHTKEI